MQVRLTSNAAELEARYIRRAQLVRRNQITASWQIALRLTEESRAILRQDVYAVPVKRSKSGRPLWVRTGELLAQERFAVEHQTTVKHVNESDHFIYRWFYGKPGGQRASPPQHASNWFRAAISRNARWVHDVRQRALRAALRLSGA